MDKTVRHEIHDIVDVISDENLEDARKMLKEFVESRQPERRMTPEQYQIYLDSVPYEDEELSDEAKRRIDEGEKASKEGRSYSFDEVAEELGL